jgi:predicted TIM-barrel fold metal-dependent hydrolase
MLIDANTFIGNWAFRRLRRNDAAGLLGMMDQFAVDTACVASADAILYRNSHAGNEKLYEETRGYEDRFWLLATLNPAYAGWERDLSWCVDMGFRGLRLYPCYHNYALDGPEAAAIIDASAEAGFPVTLPCRVVDVRQRHWMDTDDNLDPALALKVAEAHPKATFVLTESILSWPADSDEWKRMRDVNFYVEFSRMTSVLGKNIQIMTDSLGADRVLFGTGFPFKTPSPAFLKLRVLEADQAAKDQIHGANAAKLFGR